MRSPILTTGTDPRQSAIPDTHGHAKGEHKPYAEERPIPYSARMLFLWFFHACRRGYPRYLMVADHMNSLTFEDPAAVHAVRRAIKHAEAGDLYGAAEIANVEVGHAAIVHEGITRRGMRYSIGAEVDNDPRSRPDAQNIVDAMKPDAMIRSIHFLTIPHPETGAEYQWPFDNPEFVAFYDAVGTERTWELYMEQLLEAIEKLPGQIIGHFYVPAKFGHWPERALEAYEDRFIAACAEHGKAIELNTRFFYRYARNDEDRARFREANLRLLRKAKAANVGVAVGADAHSPKDQGGSFDEALLLLDEAEINEIVFPIAGRMRQVALRVTNREATADDLITTDETIAMPEPEPEPVVELAPPARPKRATSKRVAGSSSKRTTPLPAKGEAPRGEARGGETTGAAEILAPAPEAEASGPGAADPVPEVPPLAAETAAASPVGGAEMPPASGPSDAETADAAAAGSQAADTLDLPPEPVPSPVEEPASSPVVARTVAKQAKALVPSEKAAGKSRPVAATATKAPAAKRTAAPAATAVKKSSQSKANTKPASANATKRTAAAPAAPKARAASKAAAPKAAAPKAAAPRTAAPKALVPKTAASKAATPKAAAPKVAGKRPITKSAAKKPAAKRPLAGKSTAAPAASRSVKKKAPAKKKSAKTRR